jgi:hypothetical protein
MEAHQILRPPVTVQEIKHTSVAGIVKLLKKEKVTLE